MSEDQIKLNQKSFLEMPGRYGSGWRQVMIAVIWGCFVLLGNGNNVNYFWKGANIGRSQISKISGICERSLSRWSTEWKTDIYQLPPLPKSSGLSNHSKNYGIIKYFVEWIQSEKDPKGLDPVKGRINLGRKKIFKTDSGPYKVTLTFHKQNPTSNPPKSTLFFSEWR